MPASPPSGSAPPAPDRVGLPAAHTELLVGAARDLPERSRSVLVRGGHRALGRVVRDAVLLSPTGHPDHGVPAAPLVDPMAPLVDAAASALDRLRELQNPSGTFRGGDNVDSPPDSAFTVNDLAWARVEIARRSVDSSTTAHPLSALQEPLDLVLGAVTPALLHGGVHTPNHRWEIASALARLWEAQADGAALERAEQWLAEGVDLQTDGLFSERSANYAAHVSVPALLALGRILERPDLTRAADRATRVQAELTDARGLIETLASRRQDQFAPFDGGAMHPWFRAHAARTGDPLTARAAVRTASRAGADDVLTLLALAADDPSVLAPLPPAAPAPTPESPEVVELGDSALARVDHGVSSTVLFGGTDTAALGRVTSGSSSQSTVARFLGTTLGIRELRLSRDFFSLGPLRPGPPRRLADDAEKRHRYSLQERIAAEYFHPLRAPDLDPAGDYALEFNGRFAAAMDFSHRPADLVSLSTSMTASLGPGSLDLHWEFEGPRTPICLLLALDGGDVVTDGDDASLCRDERGRHVLDPRAGGAAATSLEDGRAQAACQLVSAGERLDISAQGALGGRAFYDPGEAYSFLGASDEPSGKVLLIPASTGAPLSLRLRISTDSRP
ncbi:hypothetical protein [Brachybacterium tyrofermentans]|uniref:Heparinase n=1 Tax=Brachybacterium tyrofermentans TaxID=47848 RepID=A0ABW0FE05_9MICO